MRRSGVNGFSPIVDAFNHINVPLKTRRGIDEHYCLKVKELKLAWLWCADHKDGDTGGAFKLWAGGDAQNSVGGKVGDMTVKILRVGAKAAIKGFFGVGSRD